MIIYNYNFCRIASMPNKTYAPLFIDANAHNTFFAAF